MSTKKKTPKSRNLLAIWAWQRTGAGKHKDRKKEDKRKRCRQPVKSEDW